MLTIHRTIASAIALVFTLAFASAEESFSLEGVWKATAEMPNGDTGDSTFEIEKKDSGLTGKVTTDNGKEVEISKLTLDGKDLVMVMETDYQGTDIIITVNAKAEETNKLTGTWKVEDTSGTEHINESWSAVRESAPEPAKEIASIVGNWKAVASTDNGEMPSTVSFTKDGDTYKGKSSSDRGSTEFKSVQVDGESVRVELALEYDGNEIPVAIKAELTDADHLKGKWIIFDETGQEAMSGEWKAERMIMLDIVGTWDVVAITDDGDLEFQSVFAKTEKGHKGHVELDGDNVDYTSVSVDDNDVKLQIPYQGGNVTIEASLKGKNKLEGEWTFLDSNDIEAGNDKWTATKVVKTVATDDQKEESVSLAGDWALDVTLADNTRDYTLKITEDGDDLKGVFVSPRSGETNCDSVSFKDNAIEVKVTRAIQGTDIQFIYTGEFKDGNLSGKLVPKGYEDQFSGTWTGKRK